MVGWVLSGIVIVALVAIGVGGLIAPRNASAEYGIAVDNLAALGLVRAMAVRDLVIGGLLGLVALGHGRTSLGWGMVLSALIAVVDLAVVTAARPRTSDARIDRARALHATGAIGLVVVGATLLMGY